MRMIRTVVPGDILGHTDHTDGHTDGNNGNITATNSSTNHIGNAADTASMAGMVITYSSHTFILSPSTAYTPIMHDLIIACVHSVHPTHLRLTVNDGIDAVLPALAFLNCTKRTRPAVHTGDTLLCRVVSTHHALLVTCNEHGLGVLAGGVVVRVRSGMARALAVQLHVDRRVLGSGHACRLAVGMNGVLWMCADDALVVREVYEHVMARMRDMVMK